jgi:hypothetical protein
VLHFLLVAGFAAVLQLSQLPLSCGVGGFLLARAAAEMLCEVLAAAWSAGSAAPVRRLMLLPQGINSAKAERMVRSALLLTARSGQDLGCCCECGSRSIAG